MLIIISAAAAARTPDPELDQLLTQYDSAKNREQQEPIASRIYQLVGPKIQQMIQRAAGNRRLNADQNETLCWQALMAGLNEYGFPKLKRNDAQWEIFVQHCRSPQFAPGALIWSRLSPELRKNLEHPYLKSTTTDAMLRELNALLRRRDFYDPSAWSGVPLSEEAQQLLSKGLDTLPASSLTRFNSLTLTSAFPEVTPPPPPQGNLLGYISSFIIPKMKPEIWETADGKHVDEYLVEVYSAVRPDIEAVRQLESEGRVPNEWAGLSPAERVYQQQKFRLQQRYGPAIKWWNDRVRELQPGNPFAVDDNGSLRAAKELFEAHAQNIPESLWKTPASKFYLPVAALYPYGIKSIQRMLDGKATRSQNALPQQAAAPSAATPTQAPGWAQSLSGREQEVYELIVGRIFGGAQHDIEHDIGLFLARNPRPSSQQIAAFTRQLPPDAAELIADEGWGNLARQVDRAVVDELKKPGTQTWLARALDTPQAAVTAAVQALRRGVIIGMAGGVEGRRGTWHTKTDTVPSLLGPVIIFRRPA